jgi:HSP20 family protein
MNTSTAVSSPIPSTPSTPRTEQAPRRSPSVAPQVDVFENADEILLWADVPGATREGIELHIEKGQLTVVARRAADGEALAYDYRRVFAVPSTIDATKIEASLDSGVLKVKLPKSEALKPRRIEVKAS